MRILCAGETTNYEKREKSERDDEMNRISEKIKYLPATNDPLSADVYFVEGDKYCYIYDVGNNEHSLTQINQTEKEIIVILSHYHADHTGNIDEINFRDLYVGNLTHETIGKGTIVEDVITINDGVKIEVIHCVSPHTDGSLIMNIDNEYTLIADLYFTRPPFDKKKALKMLESLGKIDTKYFVISHQEEAKVIDKNELIESLSEYFNQ